MACTGKLQILLQGYRMKRKPIQLSTLFVIIVSILVVSGCTKEEKQFHIGILQWTEQVRPYTLTYQGILDSLRSKGYHQNFNLVINYKNVEQDKTLALQTAQEFVNSDVNLIVALGTGSSLAAIEATKEKRIPIVYSIVGAPEVTGIIAGPNSSRQNITGVSMQIPINEQFKAVRELLPHMKKLGVFYCTEMIQAVATGEEAVAAAHDFGWQAVAGTVAKDELLLLSAKVKTLAEQVDAIYIPTDPILGTPEHLDTIIRTTDMLGVPVIGVAEKFVENGVLAAVHCDFYEIGRQTGEPIAQIFQGLDIREIKPELPMVRRFSINLGKAKTLGIAVQRNVILKADTIIY
jgi:putative ABC transport system substrate-binding protein